MSCVLSESFLIQTTGLQCRALCQENKSGANRTSCTAQPLLVLKRKQVILITYHIPKVLEDIEDSSTFDPNNVSICFVSLFLIYC